MFLRTSSYIKALLLLFFYIPHVMGQSLEPSDHVDYSKLLKALYRANSNQSRPLSDPSKSFEYKYITQINNNNIVDIFKSIDKCKLPSKAYLLSMLTGTSVDFNSCPKLSKYLEQTSNTSILFGYVSPSIKSPMSYFGHSFIVFSNKMSPFSRTLSYSAIIPNDANYFEMITKGATGKLHGRFTFNPLHLTLGEYLSAEQRNIYIYEVNLNESENKLLRLQAFELYYATFDYNYFTQNCTTELLQLIASVRPELFDVLNKNSIIQPSQVVQLLMKYKLINHDPIVKYSDLDNIFYAHNDSKTNNIIDKQSYIESKKANLYFKYFKKPLKNHLELQSQPYQYIPDIKAFNQKPIPYIPSNKVGIGYIKANNKNNMVFNYSPGLIERNESRFSYINETTMQLFNFSIALSEGNASIIKADFIELESFNKIVDDVVIPSWRFYIGYNQDYGIFESPKYQFKFSYGYSIGGLDYILSLQPQVSYNISDNNYALQTNIIAGIWTSIGNISVNYISDFYKSEGEESNTTLFEYKTNFINTSQIGLILSDHEYIELVYNFRF